MQLGLYEQLINKLIENKLSRLDQERFYIKLVSIEKHEAARILSQYISSTLQYALGLITSENSLEVQIEISNKIIKLLQEELNHVDFEEDLIDVHGKILSAVLSKVNSNFSDIEKRLQEIRPQTGLAQSELFAGGNVGISLDTELRKEILSANKIYLLVSFIKWEGFRLLEKELVEFTEAGGELKVITTTYMGATDAKAIEFLAKLKNTKVKVSYNTRSERLHAKASFFYRNSGFHTAYIGSSNYSKTALTKGLEWNLKITTQEIPHIIDKFQKIFESYWADSEFEEYQIGISKEKLQKALEHENRSSLSSITTYFDLEPFPFQKEILEKLLIERTLHHRYKNLIVAATGTGKTVISAFDFKSFLRTCPHAKLLFIAHRKEILEQAVATFRGVLRDNNFGELLVDGLVPSNYHAVFASVQSLNNQIENLSLTKDYYDYIVVDEVHHIAASSYRPILNKFSSKILLGLTATPERMDGANILDDFCGTIAAEIRLPEALNRKLLSPFQYFGISDSVDLSQLNWIRGHYDPSELTRIYTRNDFRVGEIIAKCQHYLLNLDDLRALCFCASKDHAEYMAQKFYLAGLKADFLVSSDSKEKRNSVRCKLLKKEINFLFVVDIFNEGVDIPEIDTILFLRPTESLTVFLQQLGRGLRLAEGKDCLTVLDFVGNSRAEYDFNNKFRALIGKTTNSTQDEIEKDFPHLPLGCSIILEKKAKEVILKNIKNATTNRVSDLVNKIRNFSFQTELTLTLDNFLKFNQLPIEVIYKRATWTELCTLANKVESSSLHIKNFHKAFSKWLSCNSYSYLIFLLELAKNKFKYPISPSENQSLMLNMLYYDFWNVANMHGGLENAIMEMGQNSSLVAECIEILNFQINRISHIEQPIVLNYEQPLMVHSRYTKDQILSAFGESNFLRKSPSREGVLNIPLKNTELLFVTLEKSEENYSPTTMYQDYAVSHDIFHWQSQNASRSDRGRGLAYVTHQVDQRNILLFVREKNKDEYGNTISYVFLGNARYIKHEGSKPMSIYWKLDTPVPNYIWTESAKLAVG